MTVWRSADSGASWQEHLQLNASVGVNPREAAAYSSMMVANETHFGILYERGFPLKLTLAFYPLPPTRRRKEHSLRLLREER